MKKFGVTAIIFDEKNGKRYFLLLHRVLNWVGWEFCKGGIDEGENPEQAVLREICEETGLLSARIFSRLQSRISWSAKNLEYHYTPFLVKADMSEPIDLTQEVIEHDSFQWVEEEKVESMLTHEDNKKVFREALGILKR
jgi:8-oxo-dGTP pyrophosphatase MutT (NUDIX family)